MKAISKTIMTLAFSAIVLPYQSFGTIYTADLDGPSESPPNSSPGTGFARVNLDTILHLMEVQANFSDLTSPTTAAHIHGPTESPGTGTAGVLTQLPSFEGFPLGATSGIYSNTFDTTLPSTWNPDFLNSVGSTLAAETTLQSHLSAGTAYFNIHTNNFPGGEIRGFFAPAPQADPIPEPATLLLIGAGMTGLAATIRKRKN